MPDVVTRVFAVTPRTPEFISTDKGSIGIEDFTDDQLRIIAADWTEALLKRAAEKRLKAAGTKE